MLPSLSGAISQSNFVDLQFDGTRNPGELRKFWQNWEHPSINKEEWSEEEIEKLKKITAKHDSQDWQTIAQELGVSDLAPRNQY